MINFLLVVVVNDCSLKINIIFLFQLKLSLFKFLLFDSKAFEVEQMEEQKTNCFILSNKTD